MLTSSLSLGRNSDHLASGRVYHHLCLQDQPRHPPRCKRSAASHNLARRHPSRRLPRHIRSLRHRGTRRDPRFGEHIQLPPIRSEPVLRSHWPRGSAARIHMPHVPDALHLVCARLRRDTAVQQPQPSGYSDGICADADTGDGTGPANRRVFRVPTVTRPAVAVCAAATATACSRRPRSATTGSPVRILCTRSGVGNAASDGADKPDANRAWPKPSDGWTPRTSGWKRESCDEQ